MPEHECLIKSSNSQKEEKSSAVIAFAVVFIAVGLDTKQHNGLPLAEGCGP